TSLLSGPRETGQCLARFAIKTAVDMPFKTLFELLESLAAENDEFQLSDCMVFATLIEQHGRRNITHRLRTDNCKEYGELEPDLDMQGKLMSSRATLTCSARGQKHVLTQITYMNNASGRIDSTSRNRYIEMEQTVKCINRRVLIAEEQNTLIEYEMEDEMIPLQMGIPPVEDLIEYLRGEDLDDE
uniref:Uncharacterized protein n=1 Tax=Caenorhabditis japonica TaxID=281687 RepID=A0A8R1HIE2_CAEJA